MNKEDIQKLCGRSELNENTLSDWERITEDCGIIIKNKYDAPNRRELPRYLKKSYEDMSDTPRFDHDWCWLNKSTKQEIMTYHVYKHTFKIRREIFIKSLKEIIEMSNSTVYVYKNVFKTHEKVSVFLVRSSIYHSDAMTIIIIKSSSETTNKLINLSLKEPDLIYQLVLK